MINEPNVTPMVDVMLVLLIIFMVVTPMITTCGPRLELANTIYARDIPDANRDDAVVVAVSRDGRIYLGRDQIGPTELVPKVQQMIAARRDKVVYIKSDSRARASRTWSPSLIVSGPRE